MTLQLDLTHGSGQITGTAGNGAAQATINGERAVYSRASAAPQAGKYTLLIAAGGDPATQPGGYGCGAVSVDPSGKLTFTGILGDGTKVAQKALVCGHGDWPFYASLYSGSGAILGWLTFSNAPQSDLGGLLNWGKAAGSGAAYYPAGFALASEAVGSHYLPGTPALNWSQGQLLLGGGNLPQGMTNQITLGANNKASGSNGLTLTITTPSGLLKGAVLLPGNAKPTPVNGAAFQKTGIGAGSFMGTSESGWLYITH